MEKIALITDSVSDLTKEIIDRYNVKILPLKVIYKDKEYIDGVTITAKEVYDNFHIEIPKTSMPSVAEAENLYEEIINEGYTHAIVVPISSGLSGTINNFTLVAENNSDRIKSFVFDSRLLSRAEGILIEVAGEMIEQGRTFNEIIEVLPKVRDNTKVYFTPDTLEYLIKGGRIGRISGTLGELLNLKPIVSIDENGKYYTIDKVRGKKQAINRLVKITTEFLSTGKNRVFVMHGGALEEGTKLYETLSKLPNISRIELGDLSPVAGVHSGPGFIAVAMYKEVHK